MTTSVSTDIEVDRVHRPTLVPTVAGLAHAHRRGAQLNWPHHRAIRDPQRARRPGRDHPAGAELRHGHRSKRHGQADQRTRNRRAGRAPTATGRSACMGGHDHTQGPTQPKAGPTTRNAGRRRGAGRSHHRRSPAAAHAPSPSARLSAPSTSVALRRGGLSDPGNETHPALARRYRLERTLPTGGS